MCCYIVLKHVHAINFLSVLLSLEGKKQMTHVIIISIYILHISHGFMAVYNSVRVRSDISIQKAPLAAASVHM